jgi:hypothetical protein
MLEKRDYPAHCGILTEADLALKEDRAEQSGHHQTDNDSQRQFSGGLEI